VFLHRQFVERYLVNTWTLELPVAGTLTITTEQLHQFRDWYIGDAELASRMSELFLLDLMAMDKEFGISPPEVLQSVNELEHGETATGVKPATAFKRPPLKGLWHKHFFAARFLATNLGLALGKNGAARFVEEVLDPAKSPVITREMLDELSHRITTEPLEARDAAGKLTGEWIIFVKHAGKNYYLSINGHQTDDTIIFERIGKYGPKDFPDLLQWIEAARGA
jgi:hypothetical protein